MRLGNFCTPRHARLQDADSLRNSAETPGHDIEPQSGEPLLNKHNRTGRRFRGVEEEQAITPVKVRARWIIARTYMYEEYIRKVLDSRYLTETHQPLHQLFYNLCELPITPSILLGLLLNHKYVVNLH